METPHLQPPPPPISKKLGHTSWQNLFREHGLLGCWLAGSLRFAVGPAFTLARTATAAATACGVLCCGRRLSWLHHKHIQAAEKKKKKRGKGEEKERKKGGKGGGEEEQQS